MRFFLRPVIVRLAVFTNTAIVTGVKSAVAENFCRCFGIFIISHHNDIARNRYLALAVFVRVINSDFNARKWNADCMVVITKVAVCRDKRRAFVIP